MIESNIKKCTFLREVSRKLKVDGDVRVLNSRIEGVPSPTSPSAEERFDFIAARAVGDFDLLLDFATRFLAEKGRCGPIRFSYQIRADAIFYPDNSGDLFHVEHTSDRILIANFIVPRETPCMAGKHSATFSAHWGKYWRGSYRLLIKRVA
jgi:hypothetical protein